jgi:hypothetical protein
MFTSSGEWKSRHALLAPRVSLEPLGASMRVTRYLCVRTWVTSKLRHLRHTVITVGEFLSRVRGKRSLVIRIPVSHTPRAVDALDVVAHVVQNRARPEEVRVGGDAVASVDDVYLTTHDLFAFELARHRRQIIVSPCDLECIIHRQKFVKRALHLRQILGGVPSRRRATSEKEHEDEDEPDASNSHRINCTDEGTSRCQRLEGRTSPDGAADRTFPRFGSRQMHRAVLCLRYQQPRVWRARSSASCGMTAG